MTGEAIYNRCTADSGTSITLAEWRAMRAWIEDTDADELPDPVWPVVTSDELLRECKRVVSEALAIDIELSLRAVYYGLVGPGLLKPDAKQGTGTPADQKRNYKRVMRRIVQGKKCGDFPLHWLRDELRIPRDGAITSRSIDLVVAEKLAKDWLVELPNWAISVERWWGQPRVVMLVIEKDALAGTVKRPVERHQVPYFCLRGYPSWTGVYAWFEQLVSLARSFRTWDFEPEVVVLYVGDHDPDGMAIPKAMQSMVASMAETTGSAIPSRIRWERVALTVDQAREIGAPSMGVKMSSTRAPAYIREYGLDAWEAEAMKPGDMRTEVGKAIRTHFDEGVHQANQRLVAERRAELLNRMREPGWADGVLGGER